MPRRAKRELLVYTAIRVGQLDLERVHRRAGCHGVHAGLHGVLTSNGLGRDGDLLVTCWAATSSTSGSGVVDLDAVGDGFGHGGALVGGEAGGAAVVDEECLAVGGLPEVAAGSDDVGGEAGVGLG